jgi:hypothetical protein
MSPELHTRLTSARRCSKMQSMSAQGRPALTGVELFIMSPELRQPHGNRFRLTRIPQPLPVNRKL